MVMSWNVGESVRIFSYRTTKMSPLINSNDTNKLSGHYTSDTGGNVFIISRL